MTQINLNQHRQLFPALLATQTIQPAREFERVERMDDVEELNRAAGLVCLEVSDEVPTRVGPSNLVNLLFSFLDAILAYVSGAEFDGALYE